MVKNAARRPGARDGAASQIGEIDSAKCNPKLYSPQAARCAMCGGEGRLPTIAARPDDPRPILRIAFISGKANLACPKCWAP